MTNQYVINPPDVPIFMYRRAGTLRNLIEWAKAEHQARLIYCAEHGYWKQLKMLNEEYSPIRVLSELKGLRKMMTFAILGGLDQLSGRERVFIRRAYEMREFLIRGKSSL